MALTKTAATVWAPTNSAGSQRQPNLGDVQVWGIEVELYAQFASYGVDYWSDTLGNLPAGANGERALVFDAGANTGAYMKISGSWTKLGDLPGIPGPAGPPGEYLIATGTEAQVGESNAVIMTPLRTVQWFNAKRPDEATAIAGTAQDKAMTPLATAQHVDGRLASLAQAQAGVSATALMSAARTKDHVDSRIANQSQAEAGTSSTVLMSPLGSTQHFANRRATVEEAMTGADNSKFVTSLGVATVVGYEATARQAADTALAIDFDGKTIEIGPMTGQRPGLAPTRFAYNVWAGPPADLAAIDLGDVQVGANGAAVRLTEANSFVAERGVFPVSPGTVIEATAIVRRITNTTDPSGDTVRFAIRWLDEDYEAISPDESVIDDNTLTVAAGPRRVSALISIEDDLGADIVAPAGAVYGRLYVKAFGASGATDVESLGHREATRIADLLLRVAALEA